jgi:hypothetical protein
MFGRRAWDVQVRWPSRLFRRDFVNICLVGKSYVNIDLPSGSFSIILTCLSKVRESHFGAMDLVHTKYCRDCGGSAMCFLPHDF